MIQHLMRIPNWILDYSAYLTKRNLLHLLRGWTEFEYTLWYQHKSLYHMHILFESKCHFTKRFIVCKYSNYDVRYIYVYMCTEQRASLNFKRSKLDENSKVKSDFSVSACPGVLCCTEVEHCTDVLLESLHQRKSCQRLHWSWSQKSCVPNGKPCVTYIIWSSWLGPMKLNLKSPNRINHFFFKTLE